ncbi:RNA methyltransferase Tgs1 [Schizosaccharomyces japonicus yFS275]|uniref:Trimethylguanosine synthase n=1 Tax=Schizosaccharomyces japonicus (strain yFS275 / FY16936) TaxID=402676 RepID=B6K5D1_SCHJY|nr:RNA methyltransferase Tgs1 [Schizosaccharomyces japonicus yFS275]EEB08735.1 RNA methyltransferase Tgs1 [Schizosaccharomyces japonicus yFS275]
MSTTTLKRKSVYNVDDTDETVLNHDILAQRIIQEPVPKGLQKYWNGRYRLFSRFDEGIWLDYQSWYSVTPESTANRIAEDIIKKYQPDVVIDAFSGCGGNTIQFAKRAYVIGLEIDPVKIAFARHNLDVYNVDQSRVIFMQGDVLDSLQSLKFPAQMRVVVFMSPPWGGPSYSQKDAYSLSDLTPYPFEALYKQALKITPFVAAFLPKHTDLYELADYGDLTNRVHIQHFAHNGVPRTMCCYFNSPLLPNDANIE